MNINSVINEEKGIPYMPRAHEWTGQSGPLDFKDISLKEILERCPFFDHFHGRACDYLYKLIENFVPAEYNFNKRV